MKLGGLILAAGLSSRMGEYKLLLDICGKRMVDWSIDSMLEAGAQQVVVVCGHKKEVLKKHIWKQYREQKGLPVETIDNLNYKNGKMFDSVKTGLPLLKKMDAVYLLPADMPAVSQETFHRLREEMEQTKKTIIMPVMAGFRKHPPLFSTILMDEILSYQGGDGLRGFWKKKEDLIREVEVGDFGCTLDADVPADVERLRSFCVENFSKISGI